MALSEQTVMDKIEVLEDGVIQVRQSRRIFDNGELVAERYHRSILEPGDPVTALPARLRSICQAVWTPQVISDYQAKKLARTSLGPGGRPNA